MNHILLTHSYFLRFDPKQWITGRPYAPLGTLYAAALLQQQGYEISFFDTMFSKGPEEIFSFAKNKQPDIFVIYDDGFNYLTKMCLDNMRQAAFKMIQFAKQLGCRVIVSSSDATDRFELYLQQGADFILLGEGEMILLELVSALRNNRTDYFQIEGLAFKQDGSRCMLPGHLGTWPFFP